ncbi:enoyl-CoA hydratase [Pigmentiphaga litoralis]|uniref:enoyl-CoA hydratase/isomerase family protein n=1 Tax=Pigmentiphaga litoralis TaxID=516702 RepID=UPI001678E20D|nr:enoyl-CoA hydratase-related protein [Pigmentiphaga litoralis]GGX01662.1 enoyl-CoA hydratase [Pigmentiphaga litoralis]
MTTAPLRGHGPAAAAIAAAVPAEADVLATAVTPAAEVADAADAAITTDNEPDASAAGTVLLTRNGGVATLTLSHPGKLNALNVAMWLTLRHMLDDLSDDDSLRCVLLRGADGNFAAGADISEFPDQRGDLKSLMHYHDAILAPALQAVAQCKHPTVAAIQGVCVGGGLEIAAHCDLRIAARSSRLGVPINRLGFSMAPGEMQGLLALVGRAVTLELLLEGRLLDADEAYAKGLLTRVVDDQALVAEAQRCVDRIAVGAPLAARINKDTVRRLSPEPAPLTEAERLACFAYWDSADHVEGVTAFLAGRKPVFSGR